MLANISMLQALNVSSRLHAAYYGDGDFDATKVEIYGYTLMPWHPAVESNEQLRNALGVDAGSALCELLAIFRDSHADCTILVNDMPFTMATFSLDTRCIVEIIRHDKVPPVS